MIALYACATSSNHKSATYLMDFHVYSVFHMYIHYYMLHLLDQSEKFQMATKTRVNKRSILMIIYRQKGLINKYMWKSSFGKVELNKM